MSTDVLTLSQWLSPAYPVGAFAYSHGLETAIANGVIRDGVTLQDWLEDVITLGSGRNDCVLLRTAYQNDDDALTLVDATARAAAPSAERLQETLLQGAAFCATTQAIWDMDVPELTYPVAVGYAARRAGIDLELTCAMFCQAFASNLVSVAVRAVPLGQTEGQAVLRALTTLCQDTAARTQNSTLDDLAGMAFLSDIAAMRHETLQPRIFRS